jgi:TRAP transporter TAXI family solute receptor
MTPERPIILLKTTREDAVKNLLAGAFIVLSAAIATPVVAQPVGLGTSPQGTLTYAVGAAVAKVIGEKGNIPSRIQPSAGTGAMIPLVNSNEIDMGFANTLELYDAYHGVGTFDKRPNPKLRTVGVIFPIRVGLFVRDDSPIKTVADMKGKTVAYGFTSQEIIKKTVDAMLATAGLSVNDLKTVMVPNLVRGVDEFIAGRVDITTFALGSAKVAEADAAVKGIRFVSLPNNPTALAALRKEFPTSYIREAKPAPNLAGVKEPINTMFYDYTIFASADMPAEKVKNILKVLVDNKDALAEAHPLFRGMIVDRLYNDIKVPYHDGAIAYFKEKGIKETQ